MFFHRTKYNIYKSLFYIIIYRRSIYKVDSVALTLKMWLQYSLVNQSISMGANQHMNHAQSVPLAPPTVRPPRIADAQALHALINQCPPLDTNSLYCNLLQCLHFAETCIVAEQAGRLVAFISGYRLPDQPHVLFVWQIAVAVVVRGQGVAGRMLLSLLSRPNCAAVTEIQTTVTPSNIASWSLFTGIARRLHAPLTRRLLFERDLHLDACHESEVLVTIGPFVLQTPTSDQRQSGEIT